ncbi:electron transporter SenC [Marinobacterium nitratireducens]|uniref:Electron transporter SenC n=1 Tax=Marinobacterium nitratireducens TaxID=518897 RepID=A0A917ZNQ4_9GAMM|nr:SCO family protein [Marinobacterium nitratireducens]GGO87498.1 electron transporter SenC [Marinobacterium nitratireducens]
MKGSPLKTLRILLVLTAFLMAGMTAAFLLRPGSADAPSLGAVRLGGDFQLQSSSGPVSLADFRGHPVVMYIGYASCPDVCPTSLAVMTQGFRRLSDDEQARVRGIFISVDPERDSPEKLAEYSAFFHPNLVGLTGTREQIDQVVRQYGAYYRIAELDNSALGYAVDHSSRLYLIAPDGSLAEVLSHNITPDELSAKLRLLL